MEKSRRTGRSLQYEPLEGREMMAVTGTLTNGVLKVVGTTAADQVSLNQYNGYIYLSGANKYFAAAQVNSITVDLGKGNDTLSLDSFANGGNQALAENITVTSAKKENDLVRFAGHDVALSGSSAHTLTVNTAGLVKLDNQTLSWSAPAPTPTPTPQSITGTLTNGVLAITGTSSADQVFLNQYDGYIYLSGANKYFAAAQVNSITIDLGTGNDTLTLDSLATGGNQSLAENITVTSAANENDLVHFSGHDVALSGSSAHTLTKDTAGLVKLDGQTLSWSVPTPTPTPTPTVNWFDSHVLDTALRDLGHNLYLDGLIDRTDMLSLLRSAEDGSVVDSTELTDLRTIAGNTTMFGSLDYVWKLASSVVNANTANAKFQGTTLGNLAAGSSSTQMEKLVIKWFLGADRPTADGAYRQVAGQLFVNGATYTDIHQGSLGDCYFVASLGEVALKNQAAINNMFIVNGDGTYTVRFFNNGVAQYVTVDSYLPTNSGGGLLYANRGAMYNNSSNELWTALAEKAYVQMNEAGWTRGSLSGTGQNSYSAIEGGYIYAALGHITGQATTPFAYAAGTTSFTTFVSAFNSGKMIGFASKTTPDSTTVVGSHAYAVVGYNATNQTITLFNPWGVEYGLVTMTWAQIQGSFQYFDRTA